MMQILSDVVDDEGGRKVTVRNYDASDVDSFPDRVRRMVGIPGGWTCEIVAKAGVSEYVDVVMRFSAPVDQPGAASPGRRAPDQEG